MTRLRASPAVARLVLAWFALVLVVGSVAPTMQAHAADAVCSAAGAAGPAGNVDRHDDGKASLHHTIECPLCLPLFAPPAPELAVSPAFAPVVERVPRASPHRHAAATAAAPPLPARGPPSIA